jgi:lysophospholipase L1-like esterase
MLLVSPPPFGKFSPFMELFFRGGEATGRGLAAAYATVAEACGAHFLDAATVLPPGPVDGVHPDGDGQRQLGETIAKVIAA